MSQRDEIQKQVWRDDPLPYLESLLKFYRSQTALLLEVIRERRGEDKTHCVTQCRAESSSCGRCVLFEGHQPPHRGAYGTWEWEQCPSIGGHGIRCLKRKDHSGPHENGYTWAEDSRRCWHLSAGVWRCIWHEGHQGGHAAADGRKWI